MRVGLVAHFAEIRLVRRVNVHVFLSVAAVCKPSVAALKLTLEGLLSCGEEKNRKKTKKNKPGQTFFFISTQNGQNAECVAIQRLEKS